MQFITFALPILAIMATLAAAAPAAAPQTTEVGTPLSAGDSVALEPYFEDDGGFTDGEGFDDDDDELEPIDEEEKRDLEDGEY